MFGEGVLATDAFATFLSSPPVANCGGGERAAANSKSVESRLCRFVLKRKQEEAHPHLKMKGTHFSEEREQGHFFLTKKIYEKNNAPPSPPRRDIRPAGKSGPILF